MIPTPIAARHRARRAARRPAVADRLPDRHRLRRADEGRHRRDARLAARRGGGRRRARRSSAGRIRPSSCPSRSSRPGAASARAAAGASQAGQKRHARATPSAPSSTAAIDGDCCRGRSPRIDAVKAKARGRGAQAGDPASPRQQRARGADAGAARTGRRLGRPHRLEQHQGQGHGAGDARRTMPAATSTTACASTRMAAAMNGMALHGGVIPYGGTFLVFTDYCRPAIRLSALMGQRVIYVMTHDSIGLGEDGPTHQPVEHLAALRAIPNLLVFRPGRRGRDGGVLGAGARPSAHRPVGPGADPPGAADAAHAAQRREPVRPRRLCAGRRGRAPA